MKKQQQFHAPTTKSGYFAARQSAGDVSITESTGYRAVIVTSQRIFWLLAQFLRIRYSIIAHWPASLFVSGSESRLIFSPTHRTLVDPWLLMGALPYACADELIPVRPLATQTFSGLLLIFKPVIKVIYWLGGVVELPPEDEDEDDPMRAKLRGLLARLNQGEAVMIFPEGERWRKREPPLGEFAPGVVCLQRDSAAPIVPVALWISESAWPRRRCVIRFGRPLQIPEELDLDAGAEWLRTQTLGLYEQAREEGKK